MSLEGKEDCPDEERISAFVEGGLDPEQHDALEAHLDSCEDCSQLVADLVRIYDEPESSSDSVPSSGSLTRTEGVAPAEKQEPELLAPGSAIGRYRTLECVGIGGMGIVYAAYDPQLDRRVALKLLLDDAGEGGQRKRARLIREAQSMAKLSHPNLITVHDVGTWHGQVFVAMEFIEGGTLKSWMRERRRSWAEIRSTMISAGRGLASAHAAGLVHRDFKPDNVLIGHDGRVRVTDFGLARWEGGVVSSGGAALSASNESESVSMDEVLSAEVSLTKTGALVGTPAYMAPELYSHEVADAATDQFAFCIALYEALYGERPFRGKTLAELATNVVSSENIEFPSAVSVPRNVREALRRGLSRRRGDRYPSMDALLAALERRGVRRWKQATLVGAAVLALGVGVWAARPRSVPAPSCEMAGASFDDVWDSARRERIDAAFARSQLPGSDEASVALLRSVDSFAEQWQQASMDTCEVRNAGTRAQFVTLAERCLAQRRTALDVALGAFEEIDEADIERAGDVVEALSRDCTDEAALLSVAPPPAPQGQREEVEALRRELAAVEGYLVAGDYDAAVQLARELDAQAETVDHDPLRAQTQLYLGDALDRAGQVEPALEALERAELLATSSRFHRVLANSLLQQVYLRGVLLEQHDRARRIGLRAEAAAKAAGTQDDFRSALLMNRSSVEFSAGEFQAAEALAAEALEMRDPDEEPMQWADAAFNLATIRMVLGRSAEAVETLNAYIATFEREVGHLHPDVAVGYHTLSNALTGSGDPAAGEAALRVALDILERTVGADHPTYANPLTDLADLEAARGNQELAITLGRRAMALRNEHGAEPLRAAANRLSIAQWLAELGRVDEAGRELDQAEAEAVALVGEESPRMAPYHILRAGMAALAGRRAQASASMERAEMLLVSGYGEDHPRVWEHRIAWSEDLLILGDEAGAVDTLRTLLARMDGKNTGSALPEGRFKLAKMLEARTPGSSEARALAESALQGFETLGFSAAADAVAQWQRDHGASTTYAAPSSTASDPL